MIVVPLSVYFYPKSAINRHKNEKLIRKAT